MRCQDCKHFKPNLQQEGRAQCRRNPPQIFVVPVMTPKGLANHVVSDFPTPDPNWCCGEFKPDIIVEAK